MWKRISILALIVGIGGIALVWTKSKDLNQRVTALESQMKMSQTEIQQHGEKITSLRTDLDEVGKYTGRLLTETGKLVAEKQSLEGEANALKNNPSQLIEASQFTTTSKGFINIQTRINKIFLRNQSRFNAREIQIRVSYVKNQAETGQTGLIYVHDLLVAGESKWFDAENAPWVDGEQQTKFKVTSVEVVGK